MHPLRDYGDAVASPPAGWASVAPDLLGPSGDPAFSAALLTLPVDADLVLGSHQDISVRIQSGSTCNSASSTGMRPART